MRNQSDLNQETLTPETDHKEREKIERMNRIRHALAGDAESKDLPKPHQKPDTQTLDVSVEDNPPPVQGSDMTRAQKMAQIREALAMVERPAAPAAQSSKGTLPPLKKKGSPGRAARKNAAAETVVTPRRPSGENLPPPVQQKTASANEKPLNKLRPVQKNTQPKAEPPGTVIAGAQPSAEVKNGPRPLRPLKPLRPVNPPQSQPPKQGSPAQHVQKPVTPAVQQPANPPQPKQGSTLPPLRKAGSAPAKQAVPAVPAKSAASGKPAADSAVKPTVKKSKKVKKTENEVKKPTLAEKLKAMKPAMPLWKICAIIGGSTAGVLVAAYLITALIYINKFLPKTYINGVSVGGMTKAQAEEAILASAEVEDLILITANGEEAAFAAEDYEAVYSLPDNALDEAFSENRFLWPSKLFKLTEYQAAYDFSYSKEALHSLIVNYDWGKEPSQDAHIVMGENGVFEIVPETIGDRFDANTLLTYVSEQLTEDVVSIAMLDSGCYTKYEADIKSEDLTKDLEICNRFASCVITFDFEDRKEVIYGDQIAEWVNLNPDGSIALDEAGAIVFDTEAIAAFVAEMANKYDTYGRSRTFRSTLDGTITVPWTDSSIYGWQIDQEDTVAQIQELIQAGETVTVAPEYTGWGYGYCRATDDIGKTYIEIDISAQHIWFYRNGVVEMESDCVTGTETDGSRRTPRGIFQIWSHESPRKLGTYAVQGYEVWVDYWMPINYGGIGLHDMNRSAFGGDIYMYNGSHGCINLPYTFVKQLFNATENGIPVIVHD